MHVSIVRQDHAILYILFKGYQVDLGRIVEDSILEYAKGNFVGNIPHPSLITLLCINGGVKFNDEEEERCPKTSPLTFIGVLKAPMESEEGEMREKPPRKRKRVETEELRDQAPTTVSDKGESTEKRGGFEADLEQSMRSPIADQGIPAQIRAEERREESENEKSSSVEQLFTLKQRRKGKRRATTEDNSNSELLAMLKEMKEELKEREEKIREELMWRDNYLEGQIKQKENTLATSLKQRCEQWREELLKRDKALRIELKEREKIFVNEQIKMDEELLKMLE